MLTDYHLHLRPDEGDTTRSTTSRPRTSSAISAAAEAGIEELGVSEHVYRFRQALDLWQHPLWVENARDDIDAYCEFVRWTPLRSGSSATSSPAPKSAPRRCWRRATSTTSSARSTSSARATRGRPRRLRRLGGRRRCRRDLAPLLRGARRVRPLGPLRHPRPPRPGQGLGRARPLPERDLRSFYEPAVEAIVDSGIAVEISTAGLRKPVGELYPARAFAELCVEAGAVRPLLRRPPARAGRLRIRPRDRVPRLPRGGGDLRLRAAPPAPLGPLGESGRLRWSGSATTATVSRPAAASSWAGSRSSTSSASRATPMPTSSPTP